MVYVLNKYGKALMPTERLGKIGYLLRHGRAVVVNSVKNIKFLSEGKRIIKEKSKRQTAIPPTTKAVGFLAV